MLEDKFPLASLATADQNMKIENILGENKARHREKRRKRIKMADPVTIHMNDVSILLSKELHLSRINKNFISLAKTRAKIFDFLFSCFDQLQYIHGGSVSEGTKTDKSDIDQMLVFSDVIVCTTERDTANIEGHVFMFDTSASRPGYGRLRLVKLEHTEKQAFEMMNINIHEALETSNDGIYLSNEKFVDILISKRVFKNHSGDIFRHGPCLSTEFGPDVAPKSLDISHVFVCDDWAPEAKEWITRERHCDWPTKEDIDKISKLNCHAVPVGDIGSSVSSLEWRISYLLGERDLVWSFNDTQVQCYVILKKLLKKYIDPIAPDQLSSYHMKTIVFWQSEETGLSMWNEENLVHCMIECLNMLALCLEQGVLEHYFHRKRNLLQYKFEMESEKVSVLQTITYMQRNPVLYILECLPETKSRGLLLEVWNIYEECLSKFMEATKNISYLNDTFEETKFITDVMHRYITLSGLFVNIASDLQPLDEALQQLKAMEETHLTDVDSYIWEKTRKFFKYRVGMGLWKRSLTTAEDPEKHRQVAEILMSSACDIDPMSGPLYLATYFLATGQFSRSNKLVQAALLQEGRLGYSGSCSNTVGIELKGDGRTLQLSYVPTYPSSELKIIPAYDVVFASSDLPCVPYPMKFECAVLSEKLLDTFEIHPCVYAYFLLCVGHSLLSNMEDFKASLHHFEQAVNETSGAASRYRGLNLLGYCHILDDSPEKAVMCFLESLQETYNLQGVVNAAVYHMLILLFTLMEVEKTNNDEVLYRRI